MFVKINSLIAVVVCCGLFYAAPCESVPYVYGWPVDIGVVHFSSPAVADVDGDGRREVAVAAWDDRLYILSSDGKVRDGFPVDTGKTADEGEESSPVLADINDDGDLDLVFLTNEGKLIALSARGEELNGWPKELDGTPGKATPVVQNLTSYPGLEVVAGVKTDTGVAVYVFHADGTPVNGWPVVLEGARTPYLSVGDFDGDNTADILVSAGNRVYAFYYNGEPMAGWPVETGSSAAGPAVIVDMEGGGTESVVFGTADGYLYAVSGDGVAQAGWPVKLGNHPILTAPAIADVNGDGKAEIVCVAGGAHLTSTNVYVLDGYGRTVTGFPRTINEPVAAAPTAADVDADGQPEVIIATARGRIWALDDDGETVKGFPIDVKGGKVTATPASTDLDGDGTLDIVVATDGGTVEALDTGAPYNPDACPWPTLAGDHWRSGKYHVSGAGVFEFEVRAKANTILVTWESKPSSERSGWRVARARLEDGLPGPYVTLDEVPQALSGSYSYEDADIENGDTYYYVVEELLSDGGTVRYGPKIVKTPRVNEAQPSETRILNAYPNPFQSEIRIPIQIGEDAADEGYEVKVYDVSGKAIRTITAGRAIPGEYELSWDGRDENGNPAANGIYVVRLSTDDKRIVYSKSVVLARNK